MKYILTVCLTGLLFICSFGSFGQQLLWEKGGNFIPNAPDAFIAIRKVNDTTVIASGDAAASPYKSFYTQYHTNGTLNWSRRSRTLRTGEQDFRPFGKGYFYTGSVPVGTGPGISVMLQRISSIGDTLWTKVYSAYQSDVISKLHPTPNSVYLAGHGSATTFGNADYFLMKADSSGTLQWRKTYKPLWADAYLCDIVQRPNGNFVLSGMSFILPANKGKLWLVEVNATGDSLRSKVITIKGPNYNERQNRIFNNMILSSDGNYLCSGSIDSADYVMGYVAKIDTALNLIWSRLLRPVHPSKSFNASRVKELPNGNYALLTVESGPSNNKFYIHTINPAGNLLTKTTYTSAFCAQLNLWSWEPLPDGGGIVAGRCITNGEAYIARFGSLPTGIKEETAGGKKYIGRFYPNPAQTEATLSYHLPLTAQKASVMVSDLAGRVIAAYPITAKGTGEVHISLQAFKSGLYNCALLIDGRPVENRKLSVIR